MDKSDHAQVRPTFKFLSIATPTFLTRCTELRSMYTVPTFQLLIIPCASGDNFGTTIRISMCQPPFTVYPLKVYKFKKVEMFNFRSPSIILTTSPEALSELHRSQESGYNMRDSVRQNHLTRAKICSKIIKYPHLEDYAVCIFCSC
jgi:hypothetical protein